LQRHRDISGHPCVDAGKNARGNGIGTAGKEVEHRIERRSGVAQSLLFLAVPLLALGSRHGDITDRSLAHAAAPSRDGLRYHTGSPDAALVEDGPQHFADDHGKRIVVSGAEEAVMRNRALLMDGRWDRAPAVRDQWVLLLGRIHDRSAAIGVVEHSRIVRARPPGALCGIGHAPDCLKGDSVLLWRSVTQRPSLGATPLLALSGGHGGIAYGSSAHWGSSN
jgi:hypothetical protein